MDQDRRKGQQKGELDERECAGSKRGVENEKGGTRRRREKLRRRKVFCLVLARWRRSSDRSCPSQGKRWRTGGEEKGSL